MIGNDISQGVPFIYLFIFYVCAALFGEHLHFIYPQDWVASKTVQGRNLSLKFVAVDVENKYRNSR